MLALVTGASSGIGEQYATELAKQGHHLIIVSNQEKEIHEVAERLANEYHVEVESLYMDLARNEAAEELLAHCKESGKKVEILVNNAGVFFFNDLTKTAMKRMELMLQLHVMTVAKMCKLFGDEMKENGGGYILNMSSLSAWTTFPGITVYEATKSFINSFSVSLAREYKKYNISVTSVCPGAVDTGLYGLSMPLRKLAVRLGVSIPPEKLVHKAIAKMFKKKKCYVPGLINRIFLPVVKHFPDWAISLIMKKIEKFQK
ncbi:MAG: SDR family NAD(P)-dependent oxidoreductase [Paludibacteraceae bacterium]|nr:SDR family NAD(P)-dependent oxidoreductase [Paludibacteraceae bacterium]